MSVNKVILVGNLGKDPEVRHLENGAVVANFPLATSETYTDKNGQRVTQTEWHNVVLWRKTAEIAERFLSKGRQVYIEGKIRTRSWNDRDGNTRYTTEVVGDILQLLGNKPDDGGQAARPAAATQATTAGTASPTHTQPEAVEQNALPGQTQTDEDDLPF